MAGVPTGAAAAGGAPGWLLEEEEEFMRRMHNHLVRGMKVTHCYPLVSEEMPRTANNLKARWNGDARTKIVALKLTYAKKYGAAAANERAASGHAPPQPDLHASGGGDGGGLGGGGGGGSGGSGGAGGGGEEEASDEDAAHTAPPASEAEPPAGAASGWTVDEDEQLLTLMRQHRLRGTSLANCFQLIADALKRHHKSAVQARWYGDKRIDKPGLESTYAERYGGAAAAAPAPADSDSGPPESDPRAASDDGFASDYAPSDSGGRRAAHPRGDEWATAEDETLMKVWHDIHLHQPLLTQSKRFILISEKLKDRSVEAVKARWYSRLRFEYAKRYPEEAAALHPRANKSGRGGRPSGGGDGGGGAMRGGLSDGGGGGGGGGGLPPDEHAAAGGRGGASRLSNPPAGAHRPRSPSLVTRISPLDAVQRRAERLAKLCQVCLNLHDSSEYGAMKSCSACNMTAHQLCYSLAVTPAGALLCLPCEAARAAQVAGAPPPEPPTCLLCLQPDGALVRTAHADNPKLNGWVHAFCADWTPETYFLDVKDGPGPDAADVAGLPDIPVERWRLVCGICHKRGGACIQCQGSRQCIAAFHPTCALTDGNTMEVRHCGILVESRKAFCAKHSKEPPQRVAGAEAGGDSPATAERRSKKARTSAPPPPLPGPRVVFPPPLSLGPRAHAAALAAAAAAGLRARAAPPPPPSDAPASDGAAAVEDQAPRGRGPPAKKARAASASKGIPPRSDDCDANANDPSSDDDDASPPPRKGKPQAAAAAAKPPAAEPPDGQQPSEEDLKRCMLRYLRSKKAFDGAGGGDYVPRMDLLSSVSRRFFHKRPLPSKVERRCKTMLDQMSFIDAADDGFSSQPTAELPLLHVKGKKPPTYLLTKEGKEAAEAYGPAAGDQHNDAGGAGPSSGRADDAARVHQARADAAAAAEAEALAARNAEKTAREQTLAFLRESAPDLLAEEARTKTVTQQREAAAKQLGKPGTAEALVQQLMPHVEQCPSLIVQQQAGSYRLLVLNCGSCSGGGRGNAAALLSRAVDLVGASHADLAVVQEVPEDGEGKLNELCETLPLHAAAGANEHWKVAVSDAQGGERVAFLWDVSRFHSDGHVESAWVDANGGRAPAWCCFSPTDDRDQLDIKLYGLHLSFDPAAARLQLQRLADHVAALPEGIRERVVLAGDVNLDLREPPRGPERLRAPDCAARLRRDCGLVRVVPEGDPGTTLDEVKVQPGGVIDQVWLHSELIKGVTPPHAKVLLFDQILVEQAALLQPPADRRYVREGLGELAARGAAGANGGAAAGLNATSGMLLLGWPDHRPLIVDLWAKRRALARAATR